MNYIILFIMYIPSMIGLIICFYGFRYCKSGVVKYVLIPMSMILMTVPMLNMIGLMCVVSFCKDLLIVNGVIKK